MAARLPASQLVALACPGARPGHPAGRRRDRRTEQTIDHASTRIVDGVLYYGKDAAPTKIAADAHAGGLLAQEIQALDALAAAARSAGDVAAQTEGKATVYTATVDASRLAIPAGATVVFLPGADPNPKPIGLLLDGRATLQVTVTDGAVSAFTLTKSNGPYTVHAALSECGRPQSITAR